MKNNSDEEVIEINGILVVKKKETKTFEEVLEIVKSVEKEIQDHPELEELYNPPPHEPRVF